MDEFERIKVIGKGSYGEVWLANHKKDQKQYVLKRINLQRATRKERSAAEQEANLLQKLKHPNIVSYKQSFETSNGLLYIAMQFCEGGDLYAKLKQQKGTLLDERQLVEWFVQITMALQYMHERNILHRDLKTQNIFLTRSKIIKLGDLGIARVLDAATDMATTLIGTPYYMSPEIFSNKPYNHKSDVWALGCCLYEMTTLKHAFNAKDINSLVYKILKGKLPPMPHQYSPQLLDLLRAMLHQDPVKRPSINRILRDPYIRRNIAVFLEDTRKRTNRRPSVAGKRPSPSDSATGSASSSRRPSDASDCGKPALSSRSSRDDPQKPSRPNNYDKDSGKDSRDKKPSNQNPKSLASEKTSSASSGKGGHDSESDKEDTIKAGGGKEQKELEEEAKAEEDKRERKKKPVLSSRRSTDSQAGREKDTGRTGAASAGNGDSAVVRGAGGKGTADSASSKSSAMSDSVTEDTSRSLPNLSARDKRRKEKASTLENPPSARNIRLRKVPEKSEPPKFRDNHPRRQRQPSLRDSSSSSDEAEQSHEENTKERQKRRENKEMNQFISMLDITLKRNVEEDNSDEDDTLEAPDPASQVEPGKEQRSLRRKSSADVVSMPPPPLNKPSEKPAPIVHKSPSMPSIETLTSTSRLLDRIGLLHKDCVQGVGFPNLKKAYDILDHIEEDEVEPKLMELLGKEKFDEYAGKIWQLKFCEEAFVMC